MDSSFLLTFVAAAIGFFTFLRNFRVHQDNKDVDSSFSSPPSSRSPSFESPSPSAVISPLSHCCTHQVFPSFHGADVRKTFLSHILKEFRRKGIQPFIDNGIERSKSIGPKLIEAIRGSKISIILLSKNYAASSWCLNELVEIINCREKLGQIVMTIFYEVDPTQVKKQSGNFGEVFRKTCKGKTNEDIGRWRYALAEVAQIAGYHSSNWDNEAAMIEIITSDISNKLNNSTPSNDFDDLIGLGAHLEKIEPLLCLDSDEVRMVGILGPSGIGKTTIARFLFKQYSERFHLTVFMENIKTIMFARPVCSDDYSTKLHLLQLLMSRLFNQTDIEIPHLGVARDRLKDKRVLVVLDDVDRSIQLHAMAKETQWFGPGSRIIITTQDRKLLRAHGVEYVYSVDFPTSDEALQIFCIHAFGQKSPKNGFEELAWEVTRLAGKLPLGLKVMGSYLWDMPKQDWKNELPRLRNHLNGEIESILKFSYDALNNEEKDLFLHIACLFIFQGVKEVEELLVKRLSYVWSQLRILDDKSLINVNKGRIYMHNLLAQLGREIVRQQSIHEPGERQFLVDAEEIYETLTHTKGSGSVIGINLESPEQHGQLILNERAFEGMHNLQLLIFNGDNIDMPRGLNYLPQKLRLLKWTYFSITRLPSSFRANFLVKLEMPWSKLEILWEGIQPLSNLKWMDLRHSEKLKELPDLSTATKLISLNLRGCSNLVELPFSIGNATNLQELVLWGCSSLVELPSSIGNATNLERLNLRGCSSLVELPFSIGNLTNLDKLDVSCSSLVELPSSMGNITNLRKLNLRGCSSLVELPFSIGNASNLQNLNLWGCSSLVEFPLSIGNATNLHKLDLCCCSNLLELPFSVGNVTNLRKLDLSSCSSLVDLPLCLGNATNLQYLDLSSCSNLVELKSFVGNTTNLQELNVSFCSNLVKLPSSIGNLHKLRRLYLQGCSKLESLPTNINLESLELLDITNCSRLKSFPEISTKVAYLKLRGTAIEEVPSSIKSWSRLSELHMSYSTNLGKFPLAFESITVLQLSDTEIQEVPSWLMRFSRLRKLVLNGCKKLVSLPQLPDTLSKLDAENCESLERLDCSFHQPEIHLNFANCFKLSKEARDLIIKKSSTTPTRHAALLPGGEVPTYFTNRAVGSSLTAKLNERALPISLRFTACILLVNRIDDGATEWESLQLTLRIVDKHNGFVGSTYRDLNPTLTQHLYVFELEAKTTSSELFFNFHCSCYRGDLREWEIRECGVRLQKLQMEVPDDEMNQG